jgi:hypothetical protein
VPFRFSLGRRAAALVLCASVSGTQIREGGRPTPPPAVPDGYAFLYSDLRTRDADIAAAQKTLPYTSIAIRRSGCFGTCPVYSVTLNLDGTATYTGERFADRTGKFSGRVYWNDYGHLCLLIDTSGFMNLGNRYATNWTDDETTTVTVTRRNGEVKSVEDYGRFAPPEAWTVERAIDGVVGQIKWTAASGGN